MCVLRVELLYYSINVDGEYRDYKFPVMLMERADPPTKGKETERWFLTVKVFCFIDNNVVAVSRSTKKPDPMPSAFSHVFLT